jgi:hypothetical protein
MDKDLKKVCEKIRKVKPNWKVTPELFEELKKEYNIEVNDIDV